MHNYRRFELVVTEFNIPAVCSRFIHMSVYQITGCQVSLFSCDILAAILCPRNCKKKKKNCTNKCSFLSHLVFILRFVFLASLKTWPFFRHSVFFIKRNCHKTQLFGISYNKNVSLIFGLRLNVLKYFEDFS